MKFFYREKNITQIEIPQKKFIRGKNVEELFNSNITSCFNINGEQKNKLDSKSLDRVETKFSSVSNDNHDRSQTE